MSKYTAEQVLEIVASLFHDHVDDPDISTARVMLRDYATLLRERESAKAAVTDAPLSVFSAGVWIYGETSQTFSKEEMDEAAFIVYRNAMLVAAPRPETEE